MSRPTTKQYRSSCEECGEVEGIGLMLEELLDAAKDAIGWLANSDVQYVIAHKLGEQSAGQASLARLRKAIKESEGYK